MISNPNLIYYSCIAKGTTVLADFNSKDADLGSLALNCLNNTPSFHSIFSHTVRNTTYAFLIEDPFTYFAIFDDKLHKSEGLAFLGSVKDAVAVRNCLKRHLENLGSLAFQSEFSPVFRQLLGLNEEIEGLLSHSSSSIMLSDERNGGSSDSGGSAGRPLLGNAVKCWKKKRFLLGGCGGKTSQDDDGLNTKSRDVVCDDGVIGLSNREYTVDLQNNSLFSAELGRQQKSKKIWKRHVWVVLSMDLIICTIMFVVWLTICRGFKCVDS